MNFNPTQFWKSIVSQNPDEIRTYFKKSAIIRWHNTKELYNLEEFLRVNCEYPKRWDCEVERIEIVDNLIITVTRVFSLDSNVSVHATSFLKIEDGQIISLDEYWGDDGDIPQWRLDMKIGRKIK